MSPHCCQQESSHLSSRLSRSFQIVRETLEAAHKDEVLRERRKSGLALHMVSALRIPDSDDETDEDESNNKPPATATGDGATDDDKGETLTSLQSYENWKRIVLKVIQKSATWENVAFAIHIAASAPLPPPSIDPTTQKFQAKQVPSHLTIAKNKSLFLRDILSQNRLFLSQVDRNHESADELQRWTERKSVLSEDSKPYVAPTLLDLNEQYDVLGGMSLELSSERSTSRQLSSKSFDEAPVHPILKPLQKLILILNEFITTEKSFVNDMNRLLLLLSELRYSTLLKVREFSNSAAFTGIYFASQTINITNTQFLQSMISASNRSPLPPELGNTDPVKCCDHSLQFCDGIFQALKQFAPFFPLFSQFIITHDGLSLLYSTLSFEDPEFTSILSQYETLLGESLLSLIIKPVQRLPRYVLLCKEIHHTLTKAYCVCQEIKSPFVLREEDVAMITTLEKGAREVHNLIADCAKQCNNSVRTHQDNLRLHQLYDMFREGGTILPIVKNDRVIVKEGELKRHHRHSGIKSHEIQVFSDMLLSSSPSGKGLKLEQIFSLARGTDTLCLPIPPRASGDPDGTWFVLVSDDKTLFFGAKTHLEMLRWIEAIHECLIKNSADSDVYLMKNQIALVNTLVGEINRRSQKFLEKRTLENHRLSTRQRSASYDRSFVEATNSIQASWWHLLDILEEICTQEKNSEPIEGEVTDVSPVSHLRRVVEHHAKEVVSRMMLTISCGDDEKKGVGSTNIIQSLLFNDTVRYIIAVGVFFEYPSGSLVSSSSSSLDFERPQLVKLFLLSDVLIGTYLNTVKDNLTYYFHIKLSDLQCSDYREGVSDYAIQLSDTSKVMRRRLSIISRNTQIEYSKRILYASTIDMKFDWLSLMMQAVEGQKYYDSLQQSKSEGTRPSHPIETLKHIPLQRIAPDLMRCSWIAEVKSPPPDMI